jgi:glutaminase
MIPIQDLLRRSFKACCKSKTFGFRLLILASSFAEIILEIMTNCGLYEASQKFAIEVGFPTKSGVSGALLSIVPETGSDRLL